jgi:excisionase family DNA binding protein
MQDQHLFNLNDPPEDEDLVTVRPNVWLLSSEDVPPILFSPEDLMRLLGLGRARVFELLRRQEIRSIKVGRMRKVSARALSEYVSGLEMADSA